MHPKLMLLFIPFALPAQAELIGAFSQGDLSGWEERSFQGYTDYALTELDGEQVLHAQCDNAASVLYYEGEVDLTKTPVLHWRWRVQEVFENIDEQRKSGDDYPARVYVVVEGGLFWWRTVAVNYVWASEQAKGSDWPNAYTANAHMLALRSGLSEAGWQEERRNVREDFKRLHGRDIDRIDGVALMTDCDDTAGEIEAWYGDIRFRRD